ncbi:MAG: PAS domain-containing protein [Flavobacteriaceae bacterium]|nr:MAG: PAS domain-containing protein [Flavobacteriaceae bacterium]
MKIENKIILLSIALGILVWVIDSLVDSLVFYEGSIIASVPHHELYMRSLIAVCLIGLGLVCSKLIGQHNKTEQMLSNQLSFEQQLLDNIPVPIFLKNEKYIYTGCNKSFENFLSMDRQDIIGKSTFDIAPAKLAAVYHEKDTELMNNPGVQIYEFEVKGKNNNSNRQVIFHKATLEESDGNVGGLIGVILDITERKKAEKEKDNVISKLERLTAKLEKTLEEVETLRGIIPICSICKNIRDDKGFWSKVEHYIQKHSLAGFTHGICPDCAGKHYPEFYSEQKTNKPS